MTVAQLMSPLSPFFPDWLYRSLTAPARANNQGIAESVHLTNLAKANPSAIDTELEATMSMAQKLTSLVLSLRKKEKIRVRQPLQKVMVPLLDEAFGRRLAHISDLFLSEVNVKELQTLSADNSLIVKKIKPNFKTLGPKLGQDMKLLATAAQNLTQEQIRTLEQEGVLSVDLGSRQFELELADVELLTQDMPGWLVSSEGNLTVALDVTLTPELKQEGQARELVHRIQNLRKDSGFDVTDHIIIHFSGPEVLEESIKAFKSYICNETLADDVHFAAITEGETVEIDELIATLNLVKVP
jgi:isoleucyl-tRNA synthetase